MQCVASLLKIMVPFITNLCSQKLESFCDYWARENPLEGVGTQEASWLHLPGSVHKAKHWVQDYSGQKQLWDSLTQPCTNSILSPPHVERNATDFLYQRTVGNGVRRILSTSVLMCLSSAKASNGSPWHSGWNLSINHRNHRLRLASMLYKFSPVHSLPLVS